MAGVSHSKSFKSKYKINSKGGKKIVSKPKWIVLQEWSQCTLACGGGLQYKHRICHTYGPPCKGEAVLKRPCNTQPCSESGDLHQSQAEQTLPPIVKVVPISNRKQKYKKCVIKEMDMDIIRNDLNQLKYKVRFPSRVVLNTKTLTIYENDSADSVYFGFNLNEITILHPYIKDKNNCIKVGNKKKTIAFCVMSLTRGDHKKIIKKWIKDIILFKTQCVKKKKKNSLKKLMKNPKIQAAIQALQEKRMRKKLKKFNSKKHDKENKKLSNSLKVAQALAWKALNKELKYEQRKEKEELMREERESKEAKKEIQKEKEKRKCLLKAFNSKAQKKLRLNFKQRLQNSLKIKQLQEEVKMKILKNRALLKARLHRMRKAHERKIRIVRTKIHNIKMSTTRNMVWAEKRGDYRKCKHQTTSAYRNQYCDKVFKEDFYLNRECKKEKEFCSVCCEGEFGEMYVKEREYCYTKCEIAKTKTVTVSKRISTTKIKI